MRSWCSSLWLLNPGTPSLGSHLPTTVKSLHWQCLAVWLQVPNVLKLLLERLRNEITRLPAVKAFAVLATSKLDLPLDTALEPVTVSPQMQGPYHLRHDHQCGPG